MGQSEGSHSQKYTLTDTVTEQFESKFGFTLTCQSKEIDRSPKPSFPLLPPKTCEITTLFWAERQAIEKPVKSGKIHSGKSSQKKILSRLVYCSKVTLTEGLTQWTQCKRLWASSVQLSHPHTEHRAWTTMVIHRGTTSLMDITRFLVRIWPLVSRFSYRTDIPLIMPPIPYLNVE